MEYHITLLPKSEVEIEVQISPEEFEPHIKHAAEAISREVEIEGFRRGKAPFNLVKKKVGEALIYERGAELAVKKTYSEILSKVIEGKKNEGEDKVFVPIGKPEVTITKLAPGNYLIYKVKFAILPEVILPDHKATAKEVRNKRKEISVTEDEVEKTLEWIRDSRAKSEAVERPAKLGDSVEIDFEVRHGGVKIENVDARGQKLTLGKGKFIPGFEEQLVGMSAGDEKTFTLVAPDDWYEKSFAGRALDFKAKVKTVEEQKRPELNDDFVQSLGNFSSLQALRQSIRDGILKEKEGKETQRIRALMIEKIAAEVKIEIPDVLVSSELEKMLGELKSGVENMGMKWENYLEHIKKTTENLKKEWEEDAKKRIRAALILRTIADKEKIEATEQEVETRANQYLAQFSSLEEAKKAVDPNDLKDYTRGVLRNEKVFEWLEHL